MQSRHFTKNRFTNNEKLIRSFQDDDTQNTVFISYRRKPGDTRMARKCAEILEDISGLHYWLDEDDACMQHAHAENNDLKKALCIEQGLDVSSALLGIIGPETFNSPWIPYEIGGARGRQRYKTFQDTLPNPLIAHLIHDVERKKVPAFVGLGTPLLYRQDTYDPLYEVRKWVESVAEILQQASLSTGISSYRTKRIQDRHGIEDIYRRNTRNLKLTPIV